MRVMVHGEAFGIVLVMIRVVVATAVVQDVAGAGEVIERILFIPT